MIVCVVCKRTDYPNKNHPMLCEGCGADLSATRGFVVNMVLAAEQRIDTTLDACERAGAFPWLNEDGLIAVNPYAAPETAERLAAYHTARIAGDPKAQQVETLARQGGLNPLLSLVRLWLDYQEAGERYAEIRVWAARCEEVLQ
jgi:hypothetical protein